MTDQARKTEGKVTFIDNPHAPEVFATDAKGFVVLEAGNVSITFVSVRVNHETTPGPVNEVVVGRLVLSAPAAARLAAGLFDFLKERNLLPPDLAVRRDQMQ